MKIQVNKMWAFALLLVMSSSIQAQIISKKEISQSKKERLGKHTCATHAPSYAQNIKDLGYFKLREKNAGMTQLPMRVHIVREDDGSGGVSLDVINHELSNLNYSLYPEDIEYFIADINYIDNSTWYEFNITEETAMANGNQVNDAVNVFWVNSITFGSGAACGYARFPSNSVVSIRIVMDNDCAGGVFWDTFVHEFGHHLNLYHTHEDTEDGPTDPYAEHVPRSGPQSNCSVAGDFLCDTAADPRYSNSNTTNCVYDGGGTDIYGNTYVPDEDNIMSYYPDPCGGTVFTPGQYTRINTGLSARLGHTAYDIDGATPSAVNTPTCLSASLFEGSVFLTWMDNSSIETGYLIERSTDGTNFEPIPESGIGPNNDNTFDSWDLNTSTTYYYRVKASNDDPDDYSNVAMITTGSSLVGNYTCANAYDLTACGTYTSPGPSTGGGANNGSATDAVWYKFTPPYSGTVDIYSCLGGTDTRLWVYTGSCGSLTQIAFNDDDCVMTPGSLAYASQVTGVSVTKGVPILIEWDDRWSGNGFDFNIELTATNACADAEHVTTAGTYTVESVACGDAANNGSATHSQYFRFTPPTTGDVDISSCDGSANTRLYVYSGSCSSLTQIASSDDDCNACTGSFGVSSEVLGVSVTAGTDIWIEWDDRWTSNGFDFDITYQSACPPNHNLSGTQNANADFETNGTIVSTQVINSGYTVDYDSGTEITLNPGFETVLSSIFSAFIDGCGGAQ